MKEKYKPDPPTQKQIDWLVKQGIPADLVPTARTDAAALISRMINDERSQRAQFSKSE